MGEDRPATPAPGNEEGGTALGGGTVPPRTDDARLGISELGAVPPLEQPTAPLRTALGTQRVLAVESVARLLLALSFVVIFFLTVYWAFSGVEGGNPNWSNTKELLQILLPAETALLGSAVGFYFGARTASDRTGI